MTQVRQVMRRNPVTVTPDTTLPQALRLARTRGVRHLPVVEAGVLVGMVSDRDLKRAMPSPATRVKGGDRNTLLGLTAAEMMSRPVITIGPAASVADAARLMVQKKISALPVTDQGRLVGIVTETDLLTCLAALAE